MFRNQSDAVKSWLQAYRANEAHIDKQLERLRTLKARMMSVGAQKLTDMPRAPSAPKDALADYVIQVESLEKSIRHDVEVQEECRSVITAMIGDLEKPEERIIIERRYLYGVEWSDVLSELCRMDAKGAQNIDTIKRRMYRMHEDALKKIAKGWDRREDKNKPSDMT